MPQKILVIGGTGLVGNALVRAWSRGGAKVAATFHSSQAADFLPLDIRDAGAVRGLLAKLRPDMVALPAANPHVDHCESHPEETRRVNVEGSRNVLAACQDLGLRLVFFSSDYVFDGAKERYTEEDRTCPINEYGRQKALVEAEILGADSRHLVIRTSGAYGWQRQPKNFVLQVLARLGGGEVMRVAEDLRYNPTYAENLAEVTLELAAVGSGGLFHVVGADRVGRYEFARRAARVFGLEESLLLPVSSRELKHLAPRPKESSLETAKVRATVGTRLWGFDEGLRHMAACEAQWRSYAMAHLQGAGLPS